MVDILVVDDEEAICETLKWMLEKEGYKVTTATDFEQASNLIKNKEFDLYFIDLVLPGGSGIDLIKLMRALDKQKIVIIITGYPNIPTLVDSIRLDTYDYIKKPIRHDELMKIVKHALSS